MKLQLEWGKPISLRKSRRKEPRRKKNSIYTIDTKTLPDNPGVYVFGRRFGKSFEALYVGQAGAQHGGNGERTWTLAHARALNGSVEGS